MRVTCLFLVVLAGCAAPQSAPPVGPPRPPEPAPEEPRVVAESDYLDLMIEAIDALLREELELAEAKAQVALRARPGDPLASDVVMDSRRLGHTRMGPSYYFVDEIMERYRKTLADLRGAAELAHGPPGPP